MAQTLIATQTLASTAVSVTFSSIPANYTDLLLVVSSRDTSTTQPTQSTFQVNGITTGYSEQILRGTGTSSIAQADTNITLAPLWTNGASDTANTFGSYTLYFPNYSGSTAKTYSLDAVAENNGTTGTVVIQGGIQTSTAAISSIVITATTLHAVGSMFSLYGIKSGTSGGVTVA